MSESTKPYREIVLINKSEAKEPKEVDKWSKLERVSKALAVAAIPVVLAVGGWLIQKQTQAQAVSRDYVQLAVSILKEPDKEKVGPDLRDWAVDLLNENSTVKFSKEASDKLRSGDTTLPSTEKFTPVPSANLTPELNSQMQSSLQSFQNYLRSVGFEIEQEGEIKYQVVPGDRIRTYDGDYYAFFSWPEKSMLVASKHSENIDLILHEYMRHVLIPDLKKVPFAYDSGNWRAYSAIDSGLAVYFSCSFNNYYVFAEKSPELKYDLINEVPLTKELPGDEYKLDRVGSLGWGGAFWQLRERIGSAALDKLLVSSWLSLSQSDPEADVSQEFIKRMLELDRAQGGLHAEDIQDVFSRRGLKI